MEKLKNHWRRVPRSTRRPIVLVIGFTLIVISGLIGWLPGPGGMVPFLLGIAVLASEFTWAERLRDRILRAFEEVGKYIRQNPVRGTATIIIFLGGFWLIAYFLYQSIR